MSSLTVEQNQFVHDFTIKRLAWRAFRAGGLKTIRYTINKKTGSTEFQTYFKEFENANRYIKALPSEIPQLKQNEPEHPLGPYTVTVPAFAGDGRLPQCTDFPFTIEGGAQKLKQLLFQSGLGTIAPRKFIIIRQKDYNPNNNSILSSKETDKMSAQPTSQETSDEQFTHTVHDFTAPQNRKHFSEVSEAAKYANQLLKNGHQVKIYEFNPSFSADNSSYADYIAQQGPPPEFHRADL